MGLWIASLIAREKIFEEKKVYLYILDMICFCLLFKCFVGGGGWGDCFLIDGVLFVTRR